MYNNWPEHPCLGIESGYTSLNKYITVYSENSISFTECLQGDSNLLQLTVCYSGANWKRDYIPHFSSVLKPFANVHLHTGLLGSLSKTIYLRIFNMKYC